jgi:Ankyrin repeats (3 copies)
VQAILRALGCANSPETYTKRTGRERSSARPTVPQGHHTLEPRTRSAARAIKALPRDRERTCAALLLEHGCNPNAQDVEGRTPMMRAARALYDRVVSLLLDRGADCSIVDHAQRTALHWLAAAQHLVDREAVGASNSIIDLLLQHGVQVGCSATTQPSLESDCRN